MNLPSNAGPHADFTALILRRRSGLLDGRRGSLGLPWTPGCLLGRSDSSRVDASSGGGTSLNSAAERFTECFSGSPLPGGASAVTLGHTVLGRDQRQLDRCREHELVHVRQYERWGPFFVPVYLGWSAWLWWHGRNAYYDNPFEAEAFQAVPEEPAGNYN